MVPGMADCVWNLPNQVKHKNGNVIVGLSSNTYERRPSWLVMVTWHQGRWLVSNLQGGSVPNTLRNSGGHLASWPTVFQKQ